MSEPIQSISQGNYILQGTVATSAGIVGDGSTQNPLRSDETVLWSGNYNTLGTVITASENFTNFERLGLYFMGYPDVHYCVPYTTTGVLGLCKGAGVANCWLQMISINQSANTMAITAGKSINFGQFNNATLGNLTASTGLPDGFHLTKVIGINRKA